jgi:hypothetical protein
MSHALSLSVHNATSSSRIVMLEPWGREFILAVDEKLEIVARPGPIGAGLRVVEADQRTLVFVEGCSGVRVIKDGMTHDLEPEVIIEAAAPRALPARGSANPMWDRDLDG